MSLVVVGAGVIGLSCAWRAARAGHQVTVVDPAPGTGASHVAGGMLAPITEAWPGEEPLLELGCASMDRWPEFASALATDAGLGAGPSAGAGLVAGGSVADAGRPAGLRTEGTVVAATNAGDRAELHEVAAFLERLGRDVERLTGRELRRLEPGIGPDVRGGLSVPGDLAVDNRELLDALRAAAVRAGIRFVTATAARVEPGRVVLTEGGEPGVAASGARIGEPGVAAPGAGTAGGSVDADEVLVAAGAWSSALHPDLAGLVRPVKGEILRLRHRPGALPPPSRTVRAVVDGRHVYLVPRDGGGLVLGATQYEAGFDTSVAVSGVRDLLRDAERVLPGIAEYALEEAAAGLRPGSPDNLPLVGRLEPGVLVATGHGRNGILLAPVTADAVAALLAGEPVEDVAKAADPARLMGDTCGSR
jgi:glycine oxidase